MHGRIKVLQILVLVLLIYKATLNSLNHHEMLPSSTMYILNWTESVKVNHLLHPTDTHRRGTLSLRNRITTPSFLQLETSRLSYQSRKSKGCLQRLQQSFHSQVYQRGLYQRLLWSKAR